MNAVRAELDAGVPLEERAALGSRIERVLAETRAICAAAGGEPDDLPGPSRQAYRFLAAIDVDALPEPRGDRPPVQPVRHVRLPGVVARSRELGQAMTAWVDVAEVSRRSTSDVRANRGDLKHVVALSSDALAEARAKLLERAAAIHRRLEAPDRGAESLGEPSRRAARWMCWLAAPGNWERQMETLAQASQLVRQLTADEIRGRRVRLVLSDTTTLVRSRHGVGAEGGETSGSAGPWTEITANQGFVDAPDEVILAVLRVGLGATGAPRSLVRDYARGEAFRTVQGELEGVLPTVDWAGGEARAGGHFHDLDESFERVNAAYFEGRMPRPALRWSRRPTERRLGHYDFTRDEVVLSLRLDAPDVPRTVVDFVVYHELLHKRHGLRRSGTRRLAHTAAFRREERQYEDFAAVQAWMSGLGRDHVD